MKLSEFQLYGLTHYFLNSFKITDNHYFTYYYNNYCTIRFIFQFNSFYSIKRLNLN